MVTAYLGVGSNLGDRRAFLKAARDALAQAPGVETLRSSPLYATAPVGGPAGQGDYLNAVFEIQTRLSPEALLALCQDLEQKAGRTREVRDGPRTLDIDLLLYGDTCRSDPRLTLPHPRLHQRLFVLAPLCDLAAQRRHPRLGQSLQQLRARLPAGGVTLVDKDW